MTRAEILDCLTDRPCEVCKFHESGRCERWDCVFEEKQKMGRWLKVDDEEPIAYDCSECGAMVSRRYRFCPDCGAKMVELQEGSEKE